MTKETGKPTKKAKATQVVSRVFSDGRLVELVYDDVHRRTALAQYRQGLVELVDGIEIDGEQLVPLRASHGLLRHGVVLLPSKPEEYGSKAELVSEIEAYIRRYVSLSEVFLKITCNYVILTWLYDAFAEVPYLRWKGDFGTGKTRALTVIGSITYKPIFASGASTVSPIFHTLDLFKGTLIFDEADFRFSDERAELTKIFNNGTTRGFPVLRASMSDTKDFDPRAFDVFGPKLVGMREVFQDYALETRFLTEVMSGRPENDVPISLPDTQRDEALTIRNKLLMFRFRERKNASIDTTAFGPELSPRSNQILMPLLSVTDSEEIRSAIREFALQEEKDLAHDRSTQVEAIVLEAILSFMHEDLNRPHVPLSTIRAAVLSRSSAEFERPLTSRYLGSIIRNKLRLKSFKAGVYMIIMPTPEQVVALTKRFGV